MNAYGTCNPYERRGGEGLFMDGDYLGLLAAGITQLYNVLVNRR